MLKMIFSRKEFQIWGFESHLSANFLFWGTALGSVSPFRQFYFIFRLRPTMVTHIFYISWFTSITKVTRRSFSSTFDCDKLLLKLSLNKLFELSLDKSLSEAYLVFNKTVYVDFSESKGILFVFRLISNFDCKRAAS